jgi:hypothetical protein
MPGVRNNLRLDERCIQGAVMAGAVVGIAKLNKKA